MAECGSNVQTESALAAEACETDGWSLGSVPRLGDPAIAVSPDCVSICSGLAPYCFYSFKVFSDPEYPFVARRVL